MTSARCSTSRPFTLAICNRCRSEADDQLLQMLRAAVRRCPHGILVTTECLLGQLTCATRTAQQGVMLLLQPCTLDRAPTERARWVGPIANARDSRTASDWVEQGRWAVDKLPANLRAEINLSVPAARN